MSVLKVHALLASLLHHEHASLALAQHCSAVSAPTPLFSALLNYRHSPGADQAPSRDTMRAYEGMQVLGGEERTNYPFALSVEDLQQNLGLTAQAPTSIGALRICEFMEMAIASLVHALESAPTAPIHTLEVLPATERRRVLYEWNNTRGRVFPLTSVSMSCSKISGGQDSRRSCPGFRGGLTCLRGIEPQGQPNWPTPESAWRTTR